MPSWKIKGQNTRDICRVKHICPILHSLKCRGCEIIVSNADSIYSTISICVALVNDRVYKGCFDSSHNSLCIQRADVVFFLAVGVVVGGPHSGGARGSRPSPA